MTIDEFIVLFKAKWNKNNRKRLVVDLNNVKYQIVDLVDNLNELVIVVNPNKEKENLPPYSKL